MLDGAVDGAVDLVMVCSLIAPKPGVSVRSAC